LHTIGKDIGYRSHSRRPSIGNTFRTVQMVPPDISLRFMFGSSSPFMNTFLEFSFQSCIKKLERIYRREVS